MKRLLLFVASASMMFSCAESGDVIPEVEKIPINISVGQQTRANDEAFENGDEVGIYVVNYSGETAGTLAASGNQVDNAQFAYDGSKWSPENSIYWKDGSTAADFYAYYPYSASPNISAHPFSVAADQSEEADFWASDFLWGKTTKVLPTPNAVAIQTNHSLSRIIVEIKPGTGFTNASWAAAEKSVKICDVKTSATIDLSTGVASATGDAGEIIPLYAAETGTTLSYKAMMIPQVVADNSKLVVVTVDGTDYVYRKGYTFLANTQHTFTVTVNKSGSNVAVTIGEWTIDDTANEGDAEDESESVASTIPNNEIWYTATAKVEPKSGNYGANIESNEWNSSTGKGVIKFDGDITSIAYNAFQDCDALMGITMPNSIISINSYAFDDCDNLLEVELPNGITTISDYTFNTCGKLEKITMPDNVLSIGKYAFNYCRALSSINIPANVTTIGASAFAGCEALQGVYITDIEAWCKITFTYDRNPLSTAHNLYLNGELVTELHIPVGIESISDYAFYNCTTIESLTIPNSVQSIGSNAFNYCSSLSTIYCKASIPPTLASSALGSPAMTPIDKIYVPIGTGSTYKTEWSGYDSHIEEKEM